MAQIAKIEIAIIGAGIAGLTATIALQSHPGFDVHVYERASELREIGASIALGPNGMRTLEKIGVHNALDDEVAFRNKSGYPMIYRHWKTNEVVSVDSHHGHVEYHHRTSRFHRAHLQQALLQHVPPSRITLSKALSSVTWDSSIQKVIVTFEDGSSVRVNLVLGADGLHSAVRRFFVPSSIPKWTGWIAFRSTFDVKRVENIDGFPDEATHWWGPERAFFASKLGKGLFTIVGGYHADPDSSEAPYRNSKWDSEGDIGALRRYYQNWNPVIRNMIDASPDTRLYPNASAAGLETWIFGSGRVTLAGDAAHAHGGAFAVGGSLAIDDAYAFALSLFHVFPPATWNQRAWSKHEDIKRALELYEHTRKPHTDSVLKLVHEGNRKKVQSLNKIETDEQLRARMKGRADPYWMHEHDVEATFLSVVGKTSSGEDRARL